MLLHPLLLPHTSSSPWRLREQCSRPLHREVSVISRRLQRQYQRLRCKVTAAQGDARLLVRSRTHTCRSRHAGGASWPAAGTAWRGRMRSGVLAGCAARCTAEIQRPAQFGSVGQVSRGPPRPSSMVGGALHRPSAELPPVPAHAESLTPGAASRAPAWEPQRARGAGASARPHLGGPTDLAASEAEEASLAPAEPLLPAASGRAALACCPGRPAAEAARPQVVRACTRRHLWAGRCGACRHSEAAPAVCTNVVPRRLELLPPE